MNVKNATLLIVDDEPANVMLLSRIFGRDNTVHTAHHGRDALALIEQHTFDVVLLDIMMPDISGLDVLQHIRQRQSRSELPVVLISALSDVSDVVQGIHMGANDYISKPFDYDVLQARIGTQVELRHALLEREKLAQELHVANEIKRRMMKIASHDLKSPIQNLTFIHGMLFDQLNDNPEAEELLTLAKTSTHNMLSLIHDFLELDVLRGDEIPIKITEFPLPDLLFELFSEYEINADRKHITLHIETPQDVIVRADRKRLRQAIGNLVSNAIKYSPLHSNVYLQALSYEQGKITLHVIDEGQGIPEDEVDKLFQAFSNISTQPTDGEHSTGLGLWSVKQMMQAQGGDVGYQVASTGGADFWLQIPCASVEVHT